MLRVPSLLVAVEILELALVPHLYGAEVAALLLADAHAFGIVAIGAEGEVPAVPIHLMPPWCRPLLFLEPLFQRLHHLVQPAQCLDLILLLLGEIFLGELPSHSSGMSASIASPIVPGPLKTWPNTRSNLSRLRSSFTSAARDR